MHENSKNKEIKETVMSKLSTGNVDLQQESGFKLAQSWWSLMLGYIVQIYMKKKQLLKLPLWQFIDNRLKFWRKKQEKIVNQERITVTEPNCW